MIINRARKKEYGIHYNLSQKYFFTQSHNEDKGTKMGFQGIRCALCILCALCVKYIHCLLLVP
jgi:NAD-dependent dihydropyrimidine dehydrogenase PreA subunit